jgi:putative thiamine transport system permease protein
MFTGFIRPPDVLILQDSNGLVMMLGLIIKEIPFLLLITLAAMPQVQGDAYSKISSSMGYGRISGFIYTTWPKLYGQIRLAVYAVIAYASSVVDVAIILGPSSPAPLAVRLLGWMSDPELSFRFEASAGALLQLLVTLSALLFWLGFEKIAAALVAHSRNQGLRWQKDVILRYFGLSGMVFVIFAITTGLIILAIWSVAGFWSFPNALPNALTLKHWIKALPVLKEPFINAITIAGLATLFAIAITLACLEREARFNKGGKRTTGTKAQSLLYLPLLVPQVGFVFGLQLMFIHLSLDATWFALVFVHLIFVLPYVFLSLADPWRAWDTRYGLIAFGLGASANRMLWRIRLPMLLRAICTAAAVGFAASLGQYLPTILIGAGRISTITTEAVALASGGNRRLIGVYAFLQMLLPFIGFSIAAIIPAILHRNRKDLKVNT